MTRRKTGSVSTTVGGILAGLDQAIFRSIPPAHELVRHARPDDAVPTGDGRTIVIPPTWVRRESPRKDRASDTPMECCRWCPRR